MNGAYSAVVNLVERVLTKETIMSHNKRDNHVAF